MSQAIECQKVIPGFSEFSVAHRCVGKGPLWFWQLEKEAESPIRGRGSEDQVIGWNQRGKTSTPNSGGSFLPLSHLKVARILFSQHNVRIGGKSCIHILIEKLVFFRSALFWAYDPICLLTHPQYSPKLRRSQNDPPFNLFPPTLTKH